MKGNKGQGSLTRRYLAALLAPAVVAVVMQVTWPFLQTNPVEPYLLAIFFCAWYGGLGPGLLSVVVSFFLADCFFIEPYFAFWFPKDFDLVRLLLFAVIASFISVMSELTHRERRRAGIALNALRTSEERYRKLTENFPNGAVIIYDKDLRVTFIAGRELQELGFSPDFFVGKLLDEIAPPQVVAIAEPHFRAAFDGQTEIYECPFPDGRLYFAAVTPLLDGNGLCNEILVISQNITARARAEEQVHFQASLLHQVRNAVIATDLGGKIIFWNTFAENLYQWKAQEALGRSAHELIVPEAEKDFGREIMESMKATGHWEGEFIVCRKDGSTFPAYVHDVVIKGTNGVIVGFVGVSTDISDRRQAEETLSKVAAIVDSSDDAILSKTSDGIITTWNKGATRIYGYSADEVIGCPVSILIPPDCTAELSEIMKKVRRGEMVDHFETLRMRKDGRLIDVSLSVSPIKDAAGTIIGAASIARDISERKRHEEALRESEQELQLFNLTTNDMFWNWNFTTDKVVRSMGFERVFGYSEVEINPTISWWEERLHPDDNERVLTEFRIALQRGDQTCSYEYRFRRQNGSYATISDRAYIVRDQSGNAVRVMGAMTDITERKRAETELRNSREQLRALASHIQTVREEESTRIAREIHDELGGALTGLKWDLEGIDKVLSVAENGGGVETIRERIRNMTGLIDSTINTVRRISSELRPSLLDDLGLVAAIEWQSQQFQARTGIVCVWDCLLENVELSKEQSTAVFRIFQEALTNVLRHAQATRVDIKINKENGNVVLSISDNGKGITEWKKSDQQSLGLLGMLERAHLIGGELDINGADGRGTVVTVRVQDSSQGRVLKMTG